MLTAKDITSLRMCRQYLSTLATSEQYDELFRSMSPVPTTYWTAPGSPPTLPLHSDFDDDAYNSMRRARREILKGRFGGGNIAYVAHEDLELYACIYKKGISKLSYIQSDIIDLLTQEGAMNIRMMKELTGALIKHITPELHKLQEAFWVFEDQVDNEWDRGWYLFEREFPEVDLNRYTRAEALVLAIPRFGRLCIHFNESMLKSFYRLPTKDIKEAVAVLMSKNIINEVDIEGKSGYMLYEDIEKTGSEAINRDNPSVLLLQRNDFMVRANNDELKIRFKSEWDTLYYLLIDGEFHGAVTGRFKFGPHIIEDIVLDLSAEDKTKRMYEVIKAVYGTFDRVNSPIKKFDGKEI